MSDTNFHKKEVILEDVGRFFAENHDNYEQFLTRGIFDYSKFINKLNNYLDE